MQFLMRLLEVHFDNPCSSKSAQFKMVNHLCRSIPKKSFWNTIYIEEILFAAGVTKKCTLPLHTLIFVCSTFLYTLYTFYTLLHIYTFFSNLHARARPWSRQGPIYTLTHTIYTHLHFYTLYTPMDQKFFRIWFSSSDWGQKIIKKIFVPICIIIKFLNR